MLVAVAVLAVLQFLHWSSSGKAQSLKEAMKVVRRLYPAHSELNERLQYGRQTRVAREALLLPYRGMTWEEVAATANVPLIRNVVDEIAEVDSLRVTVEQDYLRHGGDYWQAILRASLRGELPPFVCLYVDCARRGESLDRWRAEARRLCRATLALVPYSVLADPQTCSRVLDTIDGTSGYSLKGLTRLLEVCTTDAPGGFPGLDFDPPPAFQEWWEGQANQHQPVRAAG
jgi:hypothetical protein